MNSGVLPVKSGLLNTVILTVNTVSE